MNKENPTPENGSGEGKANPQTQTFDDRLHNSLLHELKLLASFSSDSRIARRIIMKKESIAFKHAFTLEEWHSHYVFFRGFERFDFYDTVYEHLKPWRAKMVGRRREGKLSVLDSLSMIGLSNSEGRTVLSSFQGMVMDLGSQLSEIIVNYLVMFVDRPEAEKEMRGRCNELETTIRCESLEEGNFFTKKILRSIEYVSEKIIEEKKGKCVDGVVFEERDRVFLGSIFGLVLLMEIGLFCPFFSFTLEIEDIMWLEESLRGFFEGKISELNLMFEDVIFESSDEVIDKKEKFLEILDHKIKELWS